MFLFVYNVITESNNTKGTEMDITIERKANGIFLVYKNGVKTDYMIFNGNLGQSGDSPNFYSIENTATKKITQIGTLQKAKKTVKYWIEKEAKTENTDLDIDAWEPLSEQEQEEIIQNGLIKVRSKK